MRCRNEWHEKVYSTISTIFTAKISDPTPTPKRPSKKNALIASYPRMKMKITAM
jgi:hypothetical protein